MKKVLYWLLLIFWMIIIFSFSAQSGDQSNGLSWSVAERLSGLLKIQSGAELFELMHHFIRKAAHFTEYAILGVLWNLALSSYPKLESKRWLIALGASAAYAGFDELHQYFIGGRTAAVLDVIIDTSGAFFGILVSNAIFNKRKQKM